MIPLAIPDLSGKEAEYLGECISSTFVSSVGPFVDRFEQTLARECGSDGAVATCSGTTALHASLWAAGVGPNDLVVLPAFTFIASANAISHCGASPWLVDIDAESWTLDPAALERALETKTEADGDRRVHRQSGRRVAAIMPVYTLGTPADMDRIVDIAERYGLPVVADGAAAIGASYRSRPIGQLGAQFSTLSFNGNKTLTTGGGGAILARDKMLLDRIRHLTTTARTSRNYDHDEVGFNYRMTNLEAAVGCAQIERLDALVSSKRRIREVYDTAFRDVPGLGPFPQPVWANSACWFSGIVCGNEAMPVTDACALLMDRGIDARPAWKPVHRQLPYLDAPREELTVSENIWARAITLPCSTAITDSELDQVIAAVKDVLG